MSDLEEYPFNFMNSPPCLQFLASTEVALTLWRYKFNYAASTYSYESACLLLEQNFSCEEMNLLDVPSPIKAMIDRRIAAVRFELKDWIHDYIGWSADFREVFSICFKHMVVDYAGSIRGRATAINIMESDEFTKCSGSITAYRLKKQIHFFRPVVVEDVLSQERISRVIISFLQRHCDEAAIHLLPKLNRVQAEKVFEKEAGRILRILVLNDMYLENVRDLWTDMNHLVLKNESSFCSILHELWTLILDPAWDEPYLSKYQSDRVNDVLLGIWSSAPDELKVAVSNQCISHFFSRLSDNPHTLGYYYDHDMTFALDMLKKSQTVNKAQAWRRYWGKFAMRAKPSCVQEFIKLCLPNDEAVELFKNDILDFPGLFFELIRNGLYSHLKDYLIFCTKDAKHLQSTSEEMLSTNLYQIWNHDEDKFAEFNRFFAELCSMVKMDVDELKARIIFSSTENPRYLIDLVFQTDSNDYTRRMNRLITSAQQLQLMKRKFLDLCPDYLINCSCGFFSIKKWQWFLEWCTGDGDQTAAFKSSLNIDAIFLKRLEYNKVLVNHRRHDILRFLDKFLKWYFGNEEDAKNYKLQKLKTYERIEIFRVEMESNFTRYEVDVTYELFMWFFDNSMENVRRFCKTYDCFPSIP